eukprot:UC4_evm1s1321
MQGRRMRSPQHTHGLSSGPGFGLAGVFILGVFLFMALVSFRFMSTNVTTNVGSGVASVLSSGNSDDERISLRELLSAAVDVAERGGREVINVKRGGDLHQKSKGTLLDGKVDDPVTAADMLRCV